MPSTIAGRIYNLLQAKYILYASPTEKNNEKKNKEKVNKIEEEHWNRSKGTKRKRGQKGYYYENHDIIEMSKGMRYNFDSVECPEFNQVFGTYINQSMI